MRWNSRAKRAFKQSGGLGPDALRAKQIEAIRKAGVDDAYAVRGPVDNSVLLGNIRKRRAAALDWLAQSPDRVLSREAFDALDTGVEMNELK